MNDNLKISSPWSQLGLFLLLIGGALVFTLMISGVILVIGGAAKAHGIMDTTDPRMTGMLKFIQALSTVTIFLLPAILYAVFTFRTRKLTALGFKKVDKIVFYALGIAVMLFAFPLEGWLGQLNRGLSLPAWMVNMEKDADKQIAAFLKADSFAGVLLNVFVIAVLPAICEEACFRGALQRILIHAFKNPWMGIIVTAVFFSAFHMQFQGFLPRMFLGVILGAMYWYSGSLWTSILAHCFTNAFQVIAVYYYPDLIKEDPSVPLYAALVSLALVLGLLVRMRKLSTVSYAGVYEESTL